MSHHPEFAAMLAEMDNWIKRRRLEGWPSAEVERYANRVRNGLWIMANNLEVPLSAMNGLAADAEALANARAALGSSLG